MEITKREILFCTLILSVMIGLGTLISKPIILSTTNKALDMVCAVQVKEADKFAYIKRTNVGDFLAEGKLIAIDSVSIEDIEGYYSKIEKVKEEYRMHTRVVTTTDSKGHTHSRTETYWTWDKIDSWEWKATKLSFLEETFTPKAIHYDFHTSYKETIKPKVGLFATQVRFKYYTAPTTDYGVLIGNVDNKSFINLDFKPKTSIEKIIEKAQSEITVAPIVFWVFWAILTLGFMLLFCYFENKWLDD